MAFQVGFHNYQFGGVLFLNANSVDSGILIFANQMSQKGYFVSSVCISPIINKARFPLLVF